MKVSRAQNKQCVRCRRRIPWWWFSLGDTEGWWHVSCMLRDQRANP